MKRDKRNMVILIIIIVLISLIKLNPLTKSAQINREFLVDRGENFNVYPFSTIKEYIANGDRYNTTIIFTFFAINILLYLPVAIFLGINKFNKLTNILIIILLPIVLDILQLAFRIGMFDIDSIVLNVLSSFIVFIIARNFKQKC
ncbi:VanZ family protein [Sedimentibacter hydroxybenzoicus DSM 7310]|uniref:VanZ family protein n=1 Tax=Sedimentibacter hydroxybenzoicus DSM 7310 TaxID=1123245 RepID=A0A974BMI5_SEDHY|nr:VanZ family protein [Sedimentibacter hydroxybenzoicus]NYB76154.1 VanZ family protein [Sedimentibacter hydroxybenzoicus DSM 7310]